MAKVVSEAVAMVAPLSPTDAADVEALYFAVKEQVPRGFLASRSLGTYAQLLTRQDTLAIGARVGETLVGYVIAYRIFKNPHQNIRFLKALDPAQSVIYHGAGTVVAREYRASGLGRRLQLAREDEFRKRGVQHILGLTAIGNLPGMKSALSARAALVGLAPDETALNYVTYWGELVRHRAFQDIQFVDWCDLPAHERMFADGFIVTHIRPNNDSISLEREAAHHFEFALTETSCRGAVTTADLAS